MTAIVAGPLHVAEGAADLLYVRAATARDGSDVSVTAGLLLNRQGFANLIENQITFSGVAGVSAVLADMNDDSHADLVFGLAPVRADEPNFCVYYTTEGPDSGSPFLPPGQSSGCMTLPTDGQTPDFAWIVVAPYTTGARNQVFLVDRANNLIYVVANYASPADGGVLTGFRLAERISMPAEDGAGPIYAGDFNGDGKTDLIVNNQVSFSLTFYAGNGDGSFQRPVRTHVGQARSMLLHDVDGDGHADLIMETATGAIQILRGTSVGSFPFAADSPGGTNPTASALGTGGHLEAIGDVTHDGLVDILVTTPMGLGVLQGEAGLQFAVRRIDDIWPGRSALVLADFDGDGSPDLAVGSAEGVTIMRGNGDGTFWNSSGHTDGVQGLRARQSPVPARAQQNIVSTATSTSLALCVGPSAACPITSIVVPPYAPALTMFFGQAFNGSASATSSDGSALDPAGTITFTDSFNGSAPLTLCTLGIRYGSTCPPEIGTTVGTAVGTHVFVAAYSGDATHAPSTSPPVMLSVLPDLITEYTLVSSANPAPAGQPVTFTATLTGSYAPPSGTYSVLNGGTAIGKIELVPVSGTNTSTGAFMTLALAVGKHAITAPYPGTANFQAAAGPVVNQTIDAPLATVSRLVSSGNPAMTGQPVTFTDTVSLSNGGIISTDTGIVTFLDGAAVLGTAALNGFGVASLTTVTLAAGSHTITAMNTHDATIADSSASLVQIVTAPPPAGPGSFSVKATPNPVSIGVGGSAVLTVTVAPVGSARLEAVTLSCSGLPFEAGCTFTNAVIPAGGGTTTLVVSTAAAPHTCGSTAPYFTAGGGNAPSGRAPLMLPGLAALFSLAVPGRRRWMRSLVALAAVAGAMQMSGCGRCIMRATQPGPYTMQVKGVSAVGPETEGTSVVMNVHL